MTSSEGLHEKYKVERLNDTHGKHDECFYFVLDPTHDRHALTAIAAYAEACRLEFPELSRDLDVLLADSWRQYHQPKLLDFEE